MENLNSQLTDKFLEFNENYAKFSQKGNKTAGTRARMALQDIRNLAFKLRKEISAQKQS